MRNPIGRRLGRIALCPAKLFTAVVLLGAPCLEGAVLFSDTFANNNAGWTLGNNWQIGPAVASSPTGARNGDPGTDHTATGDNGIAGTVIGGNVSIVRESSLLTSPMINLSAVPGTVTMSFWRWLNSDIQPYVRSSVEVFDGSTWVTVFENGTHTITDSAWTQFSYDVSAYKNADFRVRFGYVVLVNHGALPASGWNLDDVLVESADTAVPEPAAGLLTGAALSALALRRWRRRAA
ncbi:MAG: PEP-CTERM sorting domain-containing protein [Bryobacterales bacterium]|nr:PEP-CTERM sorting domain-containing protein [Bryobacterales bacterium]